MQAYYRNKQTGEIKLVEQDSAEMFELQEKVGPDGESAWEQTSAAHAADLKERAKFGELNEPDLGKEHQDALRETEAALAVDVGAEKNPWENLTPGEIEAGLTPDQKQDDLRAQYDQDVDEKRAGVFESAADGIADEREKRPAAQQAKGLRARAGGSDERDNVPVADAKSADKAEEKPKPSQQSGQASGSGS